MEWVRPLGRRPILGDQRRFEGLTPWHPLPGLTRIAALLLKLNHITAATAPAKPPCRNHLLPATTLDL